MQRSLVVPNVSKNIYRTTWQVSTYTYMCENTNMGKKK
jgi:hypothetical protein